MWIDCTCGCPGERHRSEPPYPCMDCECAAFALPTSEPSPAPPTEREGRIAEILARVGVTPGTIGVASHRCLVQDLARLRPIPLAPTEREEREAEEIRRLLRGYCRDVARPPHERGAVEDVEYHYVRRLARLRTHSPEERERDEAYWDAVRHHVLSFAAYVLARGGLDPEGHKGDRAAYDATVTGAALGFSASDEPLESVLTELRDALHSPEEPVGYVVDHVSESGRVKHVGRFKVIPGFVERNPSRYRAYPIGQPIDSGEDSGD